MRLNPFLRCRCGKIHVISTVQRFTCKCGRDLNGWHSASTVVPHRKGDW